jgi:hypothetical protein
MRAKNPKRFVWLLLTALLVSSFYARADDFDSTIGGIHFDDSKKIDAQGVLVIYQAISQLELIVDSRAKEVHPLIIYHVKFGKAFTKSEALKLMEKTLLEEAGIVITHLDDKRASVTYNDAIPIKKEP